MSAVEEDLKNTDASTFANRETHTYQQGTQHDKCNAYGR